MLLSTNRFRALLSWALLIIFIAACAEERDPINRVQPNVLEKTMFTGEWYYQPTVVDVPSADGFTFVGHTDHSGLRRVTWDIQENFLFARRTTELIKGADDKATTATDYSGEVVAAFKIEKHFDIVNAYNSTTGEKLNILEENSTDRPWYQREYIRVDWAKNMVTNAQLDFEVESAESVPYYVQEIDPKTGERHPDAPYFEEDGTYFDITNKLFAKGGVINYPPYGDIAACYFTNFGECGAAEYTIRHSFKKIDPNHQYQPMVYKGKATEVFGFFETSRLNYDDHTGIKEQGRERYINRHNLFKTWFAADGSLLAPKDRELRPIVYFVNRQFTDDLKPVARKVAAQWNEVYTDTVKAMGHEPAGDVFILCENNPVQAGDPAECGAAGNSPRLGDIRYSFMAYIPKYMTYGLLGLGPSNNDPETGEIISGMGYVYHHNNTAAYRVQEMIELLNGDLAPDAFIEGLNVQGVIDEINKPKLPSRQHSLADAEHMVKDITEGWRSKFWAEHRRPITPEDEAFQKEHGHAKWIEPALQRMYDLGINNGEKHSPNGKLANLKDTYIEDLLLNEEILLAAGFAPGTEVTEDVKNQASVARGGFASGQLRRQEIREKFAESRNMYLMEMADDALMGLARELKGKPSTETYNVVREAIYTAVLAHEVGHSLGLMHNFGGSDDAINYHDEYWQIRDDGNVGPRLDDPMTQAEIDGKLYNYAYSSVMDYAGRYTIDGKGIGKYDRAAILFGYGEKVEAFKDNGQVPHEDMRDWYEGASEILRFNQSRPASVHYTSFFNRMGDKLYKSDNRQLVDVSSLSGDWSQAEVDGKTLSRVPYVYCSHSRANLGDSCLTRDFGADPQERMKNILDDLDTWYITRNFTRGSIGWDSFEYVGRWYGRIYNRMKRWQDLYSLYADLLPQFYQPNQLQDFLTDSKTGWGGQTWGVQNAFNYLVQTVLMPNVASYGGPYNMGDGTTLMAPTGLGTPLDVTQARYFSTSWQSDRQCGYQFWECLHHIGFYLDKVMAIEALSDSTTNFVARSTPEDIRQWELSYYKTFPNQITAISEAMMRRDFSRVGPYLDGQGQLHFPNYAGALNETHSSAVDPAATFSVQLYWQVLGQARFPSTFNRSFVDEARVFIVGSGSGLDLDASDLYTFREPVTGITYGALDLDDRKGSGLGTLERANVLKAGSNYCDDQNETATEEDDCNAFDQQTRDFVTGRFLEHLDIVKVMADLSPMMTYGDPYNP